MMRGACLCGAVSFEVVGSLQRQPEACHCSQCRRQTSYVFVGVNVLRSDVTVHGGDKVTWYASSEKVRRGFCSVCGSALFWNPTIEGYEFIGISMGAFAPPTGVRVAKHTFVRDKGDYYEIHDGLPQSLGY
jgi:hypothetical protein